MRIKNPLTLFLLTAVAVTACDTMVTSPTDTRLGPDAVAEKNNYKPDRGKGWKLPPEDPEPEPTPEYVWYQVSSYVEFDALYRFGIDNELGIIKLETDPTVTSWGTDYWGSWADPFPFDGSSASYVTGLSHITYTFEALAGGGYDVTKTHVRYPYLGGDITTTTTYIGVYLPAG